MIDLAAIAAPSLFTRPPKSVTKPSVVFLMTNDFQTGGSERQLTTLARALKSDRLRIELGCMHRYGALAGEFQDVPEFHSGGSFLSLHAVQSAIALGRHLQARKVAIAHSFDFYSNLMMIPAARLAGVPRVVGSQRQIGDLLTPLQFGIQCAIFLMCDRVVFNSQAAANRVIEAGLPRDKAVIIPNGIPNQFFRAAVPAVSRTPGILRVGMIARMNHPSKNHLLLLRAAARLAKRRSDFELALVGDGPLRAGLEELAGKLGLAGRVHFLGERHDIPEVLASLDVFVLTSASESSPNAVLEAMAAGVPVIATRVGGNPEITADGETGLLVPPDSEEKIAQALELYLDQPSLRQHCAHQAQRFAQARFTLANSCRLYEELYRSLLPQPERSSSGPKPLASLRRPSDRIRVAIVAASPRWIGGQGAQAEILMRHWADDPEVDARFIPIDPEFPAALSWVERVPVLRTMVRMPLYLKALWDGMRDAEIAHVFSASYWSFLLAPAPACLIAKLRGAGVMIHYHSAEAHDHLTRWRSAPFLLRRVDSLVVPSQYLVDVFAEFNLRADIVPNVIDADQFGFRRRTPVRPHLVCTRGFGAYYSVDHVVRAFALVKKESPDATLTLIGAGPMEPAVRQLVQELKLGGVEFTSAVRRDEIPQYYDRADIFINASWLDNMPVSILEAWACGTPVVSTAPDGIRYLVKHERTGLLCAPGDFEALAGNVIRLLRDSKLAAELAQNGYAESLRYHWAEVRSQWLQEYRSLSGMEAAADNTMPCAVGPPP